MDQYYKNKGMEVLQDITHITLFPDSAVKGVINQSIHEYIIRQIVIAAVTNYISETSLPTGTHFLKNNMNTEDKQRPVELDIPQRQKPLGGQYQQLEPNVP